MTITYSHSSGPQYPHLYDDGVGAAHCSTFLLAQIYPGPTGGSRDTGGQGGLEQQHDHPRKQGYGSGPQFPQAAAGPPSAAAEDRSSTPCGVAEPLGVRDTDTGVCGQTGTRSAEVSGTPRQVTNAPTQGGYPVTSLGTHPATAPHHTFPV